MNAPISDAREPARSRRRRRRRGRGCFPVQFRVDYATLLKLALAADRHGGVPKDEIAAEVLIQSLDTRSVDEFIPRGE